MACHVIKHMVDTSAVRSTPGKSGFVEEEDTSAMTRQGQTTGHRLAGSDPMVQIKSGKWIMRVGEREARASPWMFWLPTLEKLLENWKTVRLDMKESDEGSNFDRKLATSEGFV
ncbi:hypothetical protein PIB30_030378 [Stylosanthes scabra]|uniref:Uncharacterized protein n=1 Tax=Stylosanthes scabra TaxID=79078 RepID=A0ABU6XB81_9FABA|nr:hypothetical protein [Stylosanthes scabra]